MGNAENFRWGIEFCILFFIVHMFICKIRNAWNAFWKLTRVARVYQYTIENIAFSPIYTFILFKTYMNSDIPLKTAAIFF